MADPATLQARLDEAEQALHELLTGRRAVTVDYDGTRTQFTAAEEAKLRAYIDELKRQLGTPDAPKRRAIGMVFP